MTNGSFLLSDFLETNITLKYLELVRIFDENDATFTANLMKSLDEINFTGDELMCKSIFDQKSWGANMIPIMHGLIGHTHLEMMELKGCLKTKKQSLSWKMGYVYLQSLFFG